MLLILRMYLRCRCFDLAVLVLLSSTIVCGKNLIKQPSERDKF